MTAEERGSSKTQLSSMNFRCLFKNPGRSKHINTYYLFSLKGSLRGTLHKNIPSTAANLRLVIREPILQKRKQKRSSHCLGLLQRWSHYTEGPLWKEAERTGKDKNTHQGPRLPWGKFLSECKSGEWLNPAYLKAGLAGGLNAISQAITFQL